VKRLVLSLIITTALAFTAAAEKIGRIVYQQSGNYKFPQQMLQFNVQEHPGDVFNDKLLNDDIKRLFATGFFADVVAETKKVNADTVDILFKLKTKPVVKQIVYKGNQKFPTDDLKKETTLEAELPLNDVKLRESTNKIRAYYKEKGYNEATIAPVVKVEDADHVTVTFNIDEKLRLKVNDVTFEGNTVFSSWDLKNALANRHSFLSRLFEVGLFDSTQLETDQVRLREMYWNKGYLDFKVIGVTTTPEPGNPEYMDIHFKLYEGKPYKINKVTITGTKKFTPEQLVKCVTLRKGETYDKAQEDKTKDNIEFEYAVLGYADYTCRVIRYPDFQTHLVDLEIQITEGIPFTVQDVNIKGNKVTKDKVIRRELAIQPGDPVDKNRIEASKNRLMGMGYFKDVKAVTVNDEEYGKKDVNISVEEKSNFEFTVGGGYSDTDSLAGTVALTNNNFDITDPEHYFQGGGQRLRVAGLLGLERQSANIDFTEPWLFDMPLRFDLGGYWNQATYENWSEQRIGVKTGLTKKFYDDFTSASLGYKFEQVNVYDMDRDASQELKAERGRSWVSSPSIDLARDTRDSLTDPTRGYLLDSFASITPKVLGSTNNTYRLEQKGSHYMNFFDKAIVWQNGGKVGTVSSFNRDDMAPLYERYFLGGGDTVRGFPYRRISPVDDNKDNIGGQTMVLMTSEVTHPIWKFIRGAIFVDAGTVGKNSYSTNFNNLNMGAGYGFRIKLPMINAPIKLDLAYPILNNQPGAPERLQFHFNMGAAW